MVGMKVPIIITSAANALYFYVSKSFLIIISFYISLHSLVVLLLLLCYYTQFSLSQLNSLCMYMYSIYKTHNEDNI